MLNNEKKALKTLCVLFAFVAVEVALLAFDQLEICAVLGFLALMAIWVSCGAANPVCVCGRCGKNLGEGDPIRASGNICGANGIVPVLFGTCKDCGGSAQQ